MVNQSQQQKQQIQSAGLAKRGRIVTRPVRGALARRKQVAEYRLKGVTNQSQIARELGVSRSLVCRDFVILDKMFMEQMAQDTAAHKALDLRRIEEVIGSLWDQRSNVGVARTIVLYLERKAALLGLDAPKMVDITDWRAEARKMGVDPDSLYRDMVGYVAQRVGAVSAMPILDLEPGEPFGVRPDQDDATGLE